jgi:hypothetical protein
MTTYTIYNLQFGKNTWSVMIGKTYIVVTKTSLPRHMQFGKTFKNWSDVESNYKDSNLKTSFLLIQSGLIQPTQTLEA